MLENEKIWILQNILSNVEEHNSAKLLRESLFKIIDGFAPLITASGAGIYTGSITPASNVPVEGDKVFLVTQPGTYTNFGNVVLPENNFGFIFKNGNNFSIQSVEMPTYDDILLQQKYNDIKSIVENVVVKDEFANMVNPQKIITGTFINYSNGNYAVNENSNIYKVDIIGGETYTISNRTTSANNNGFMRMAIVLYDAQGNRLKPLKLDNTEYLYYSTSEDDSDTNGGISIFKAPMSAKTLDFTVNFGSALPNPNLMMNKGEVPLPYVPYSIGKLNPDLKEDVINDVELAMSSIYIAKRNREAVKIENRTLNDNGDIIRPTSAYDVYSTQVKPNSIIKVKYRSTNTTGIAYYDAKKVFKGYLDYGNNAIKEVELQLPIDAHYVNYVNLKTSTDTYIEYDVVLNEVSAIRNPEVEFTNNTQIASADGRQIVKNGVKSSDFIKVNKGESVYLNIYQSVVNNTSVAVLYDEQKLFVQSLTNNVSGIFTREITQDGYVRFSTDMVEPYEFKIIRAIDLKEDVFDDSVKEVKSELQDKADLAFQFDEYYKNRKNASLENVALLRALGQEPKWYGYQYVEKYMGTDYDMRIASSEEDMILHAQLPIQSKIRRCVTDRITGEVKYYLDANNSLLKENGKPAKLDGTDGNFMVEIPDFYYKCEREAITIGGNTYNLVRLKISEFCVEPDWIFSRKCYTSAVEAIADRELNELCSVITTNFSFSEQEVRIETATKHVAVTSDGYSLGNQKTAIINSFTPNATRYRGGYNNSDFDNSTLGDDDFERNQLGRPIAYINRGELNKMIPNSNFTVHKYDTLLALTVLYIVEYATTNAQLPFSPNNAQGYKTGGTGMGATVYPNYNAFEYFWLPQGGGAVLPQGVTLALGNNTGQVYYKMTNVPIEYTGNANTQGEITLRGDVWMPVLSYRGIEHFYGHLYKIIDQININIYLDTNNIKQADLYYQPNPYRLSDENVDGYRYLGKNSTTGNYVEEMTFTEDNNRYSMLSKTAKSAIGDGTKYGGDFAENLFHNATTTPKVYYTTYNGRIVSGSIVGLFFSCALYKAIGGSRRPSDTTRLDHY